MNEQVVRDFYSLVSKAREGCAGSSSLEVEEIQSLLKEAYHLAHWNRELICYEHQISSIMKLLSQVKVYGDRLAPDGFLCDILNDLLKRFDL